MRACIGGGGVVALAACLAFGACGRDPGADHSPMPRGSAVPGITATGDPVLARVTAALARVAPGAQLEHTADDTVTLRDGAWSNVLSLDNLRRSCASSPAECDDALASIASIATASYAARGSGSGSGSGSATGSAGASPIIRNAKSIDRTHIKLTPKPTAWFKSADVAAEQSPPEKREDNRLVRAPFAADLQWVYVDDEPNGMRILNAGDARDLGLDPAALRTLALANLAAQYPTLTLTELAAGAGVWTLEPGDYLDSARFALDAQWKAFAAAHGGHLLATVPARGRIFVVIDPAKRPALAQLTEVAFGSEDHPLSTAVLEWTGSGWHAAP